MLIVIGLIILLFAVFGVFVQHGGSMDIIMEALPSELAIILGAGVASMIIGNNLSTLKGVITGLVKVVVGPKWKKRDYIDTIVLVTTLLKSFRTKGPKSIESDIEEPQSSAIFEKYPRLMKDRRLIRTIADTIRLMVASPSALSAYAVEDLMDQSIRESYKHATHPAHALFTLSGALPALGIVACVLGIVKTMASIDQPPSVLGSLIGSALIGTFLGVFLAYGVFEPIARKLEYLLKEEEQIYHVVKQLIVATLHGHPQPLVIEAARVSINGHFQPTFDEVFDVLLERPAQQENA